MGEGWDEISPGSGGPLAVHQREKGYLRTRIQTSEENIRHQEIGWHRGERGGRRQVRSTGELGTFDAKLLGTNMGDGRNIEGRRGG